MKYDKFYLIGIAILAMGMFVFPTIFEEKNKTSNGVNENAVVSSTVTAILTATPMLTGQTDKPKPGFEAVFVIVGLLAVAFLVLRQ